MAQKIVYEVQLTKFWVLRRIHETQPPRAYYWQLNSCANVDYPVLHPDGFAHYDRPETIPGRIRKMVHKAITDYTLSKR